MSTTTTSSEKVETVTPSNGPDLPNTKSTTQEAADISGDLIRKVSKLPQITPDWSNRRRVVFYSLYFSGTVISILVITICVGILIGYFRTSHSPIDQGLIGLSETLIYSMVFFASGVVGAYCFGVAFEVGAYRNNITALVTSVATAGNQNNPNNPNSQN